MMNYFTLRKLAIRMSNIVKGFIRTVTGIPPITLESCVDDKSVINYQLYGNSVQNGTPSPEKPVEVVSVGEKTKNLWDIGVKEFTVDSKSIICTLNKPITKPCTFFYRNNNYSSNGNVWLIGFLTEDKSQITVVYPNHIKQNTIIKVNASEEKPLSFIQLRNNGTSYISGGTIDNFMLVEGTYTADTIPEYEPYGMYKIPVTAHGKNLIPEWKNGWIAVSTGVLNETNYPNRRYTDYIPIKSNTEYYISGGGANSNYTLYDENFGYLTGQIFNSSRYIMHSTAKYIRIAHTNTNTGEIQLEKGAIGTEYEPYIEPIKTVIYAKEPGRGVGEYRDSINSENKKLVRNIAESQFLSSYLQSKSGSITGTSTGFLVSSTSPFGKAKTGLPNGITYGFNSIGEVARNAGDYNARKPNTVCWMPNTAGNRVSLFAMPTSFLTDNGYTNDLTGVEDWVDAQNAISPIMITYILETPTEEDIELPYLPTFKNKNATYTIDTTVQPSEMSVTYYSNTKGE